MALENIAQIESALKLEVGTLVNALASEEAVTVAIPELVILTKAEDAIKSNNLKQAGVEVAVKNARESLGLSFEGKTIDNLLTAFKNTIATTTTPDAKVTELQTDVDKLRNNLQVKETEYNGLLNDFNGYKFQQTIDTSLNEVIKGETIIPKSDVANLFKLTYKIENVDGVNIVKQNGEVLKNPTTLSPLSIAEVAQTFVTTYLKPVEGGRADTSTKPPTKGTMELFNAEMKASGINEGTLPYQAEMAKRIADKTLTF